jgi:hypothetical protein
MYHAPDIDGDGLRTAYLNGSGSVSFFDAPATWDYVGCWQPDGSAYYWLATDAARTGWQLYRRDSSSGAVSEVAAGDNLSLPTWTADGATMAWSVATVQAQLWVIEESGW